jgi:hypothetical protein
LEEKIIMKTKLKVLLAFSILFLVSTIVGVVPATAVKSGGGEDNRLIIKGHLTAEGNDFYDEGARVEIAANIYWVWWEYIGLEKASVKKIQTNGEETMLFHGEIKDGQAGWYEWYLSAEGVWWNEVWFISGYGVIKTPSGKESDVFIGIIFCMGGNFGDGIPWAWVGYYNMDWTLPGNEILGPEGTFGRLGTIVAYPDTPQMEMIGLEQYPQPPPPV